jgi:hypothetical protein
MLKVESVNLVLDTKSGISLITIVLPSAGLTGEFKPANRERRRPNNCGEWLSEFI